MSSATDSYRFDVLASQWWDMDGPMALLHEINPLRISWLQQTLKNFKPSSADPLLSANLLDIGCGGGILAENLYRLGANVTAIDIQPSLIQVAQKHASDNSLNIDYLVTDAENLSIKRPHEFDIITCLEVIEHHPEPQTLLKACSKLLKPSGILIMSTLNRTLASKIFAIHIAENILGLLPKNTHQWHKFISPSELSSLMTNSRLKPFSACGMTFNPLTRTWQLNRHNLSINYFMSACH